jgi:hypothetical protein
VRDRKRKLGQAHAARLERLIKARRAAAAPKPEPAALTPEQKTASHPRLRGARVAQPQQFQTVQENNHARLL